MRYVGFIRNVMHGRGGFTRVEILARMEALGAGRPVTHMTTGNIAFDLEPDALPRFVAGLEAGIADMIGRHEPVYVRTIDEFVAIVDADPFAESPIDDAVERVVCFAKTPLPVPDVMPVVSRRGDVFVFRIDETEAYGVSRMVDGRTSGSGGLMEHLAGQRITARAWSTLSRIARKER